MNAAKPLSERIAEQVNRSDLSLPLLNPVALELQRTLQDEHATIAGIEQIIGKDPALVCEILRMANSCFVAGLSAISTLREALTRRGAQRVAELALAAARRGHYQTSMPLLSRYVKDLWQQAYACSPGSRWVAERCGFRLLTENAFLAGLLHDIGKLFILKLLEDLSAKGEIETLLPDGLVDEILESLHNQQGYVLMKQWGLPRPPYCGFCGRQHRAGDRAPARSGLPQDGDRDDRGCGNRSGSVSGSAASRTQGNTTRRAGDTARGQRRRGSPVTASRCAGRPGEFGPICLPVGGRRRGLFRLLRGSIRWRLRRLPRCIRGRRFGRRRRGFRRRCRPWQARSLRITGRVQRLLPGSRLQTAQRRAVSAHHHPPPRRSNPPCGRPRDLRRCPPV